MKKSSIIMAICGITALCTTSCTTTQHSMKDANVHVELNANDFTLSDQVTGEAHVMKILGIDPERILDKKTGSTSSLVEVNIPVIGNLVSDKGANYALYELMQKNPGYDVVVYPQVEKSGMKFGTLYSDYTYKVTARLGKLKKK
jgi:hypothetical protein